MVLKLCGICLEPNKVLIRLTLDDGDNLTALQKLQKVAPFQDWLDCYSICQNCKNLLETSYYFIDMCVKYNEKKRKLSQKGNFKYLESSNDIHWEKSNLSKDGEQTEGTMDTDTNEDEPEDCDNTDDEQLVTEYITIQVEEPKAEILPSLAIKEENDCTNTISTKGFKCILCNKSFITFLTLEMHSRIEHRQKCSFCLEVFTDKTSLDSHVRTKHPGHASKFTCEVCSEKYCSEKTLIRHCEKKHSMKKADVRPYSCNLCEKRLKSLTNFRRHMSYHEGTRRFTCTFCGKSFITKKDLIEHERIHLNEKKYKCEKCNKRFNTYSNFRSHNYATHRQNDWKYACDLCPKRFPWKAQLVEHIKRHNGIKDHQCVVCGLWYTTKHDMERHMYYHTKDRPHKCELCPDKSYRDRKGLRGHMDKCHGMAVNSVIK